jgi:hypothetical protein
VAQQNGKQPESLQHPYDMQLLTHKILQDIHEFTQEKINAIEYFYVSQADITKTETGLRNVSVIAR